MNVLARLNELGKAVDAAEDARSIAKLEEALLSLKALDLNSMIPMERARMHQYCANALAAMTNLQPDDSPWWNQPLFEEEMIQRRFALKALKECVSEETLECQVLTNLGNSFSRAGRFTEALNYWNKAIAKKRRVGMALANRGRSYFDYAFHVETNPEQTLLLRDGHESVKRALAAGVEEHAKEHIQSLLNHMASFEDWDKLPVPEFHLPPGISPLEKDYRQWCRSKGLFLSPLNDLFNLEGIEDIRDSIHLPNIVVPVSEGSAEPPAVYGMFNQAKQEFVSARYLAFEAIREKDADELHFSDRDVFLLNMLDYRLYRLWVERLKMSFLAAHAILDKLAYLMNDYWKFGLAPDKVSFGGLWFTGGRRGNGISTRTKELNNWALQGLFWLSRDFYDTGSPLAPPEARMLHEIRNHIAHKYLRVHDELVGYLPSDREERARDLSFQVTGEELMEHTLQLLKLVRSAMMYLAAAMVYEEKEKSKNAGPGLTAPMTVFRVYDDNRL